MKMKLWLLILLFVIGCEQKPLPKPMFVSGQIVVHKLTKERCIVLFQHNGTDLAHGYKEYKVRFAANKKNAAVLLKSEVSVFGDSNSSKFIDIDCWEGELEAVRE